MSWIEEERIGIYFLPFVTLFFYKQRTPEYTIKLWTDKYLLDTYLTYVYFWPKPYSTAFYHSMKEWTDFIHNTTHKLILDQPI